MRVALLAFYSILIVATSAIADTIQIDSLTWTQEQKNGATVACLRVLYDSGITHQGVNVNLPNVEVVNPSAPVISVLTKIAVEAEYQQWMDELAVANAIEQTKIQAMQTEMAAHDMKKITLADIDSRIDGISNLTQAKAFLKKLTHYLWAKGYFEND